MATSAEPKKPHAAKAPPAPASEPKSASQPPEVMSVPLPEEPPPPAQAPPPESLPAPSQKWKDGTYAGWGYSNHGDIEAEVTIRDGRIVVARIATCATRYPCDVIDTILDQPVLRQNPDVDNVSRATESADAYYYGLLEALKQALDTEPPAPASAPAPAPAPDAATPAP